MATLTDKTPTDGILVEYERAPLYPKQQAAIFDEARISVVEATTKAGKTDGCLIWLSEQAILNGKHGRNFWWVAPSHAQTKVAYRRMRDSLSRDFFVPNESELTITLVNGARISFKTGENPDLLYGEDVYAAVIDEASRCREEAWFALRSTLTATQGPVRIIGNVKGRKNWAYRIARQAESGVAGMAYHKLTWRDAVEAGIMPLSEVENARAVLPSVVFKELFEAEPSDDGGNPFGIDAIRGCLIDELSKDPVSCWGWDLAKSQDWTVGIALDAKGRMVQLVRFQKPWRDTKQAIIEACKGRRALIDSTGVGDPILEDLQAGGGNFEGFKFTNQTKQRLMEGLVTAIQQRQIGLTPGLVVSELEAFEYEYTRTGCRYSAPDGLHDDCVCALSLAVQYLGVRSGPFRFQRITQASEESALNPGAPPEFGVSVRRDSWETRPSLI